MLNQIREEAFEFKHDDNGANMEWDQQQQQGWELPPQQQAEEEAVPRLQKKLDLTDDKIDWELVLEEDLKLAEQKGLQEQDKQWCACSLKPKFAHLENHAFHRINTHIAENIACRPTLQLLTEIQDIYNKVWNSCDLQGNFHFWFRRSIYEHLYGHGKTHYTRKLLQLKTVDKAEMKTGRRHMFPFDQAIGEEICDHRAIASFGKLVELSRGLMKDIESDQKRIHAISFM